MRKSFLLYVEFVCFFPISFLSKNMQSWSNNRLDGWFIKTLCSNQTSHTAIPVSRGRLTYQNQHLQPIVWSWTDSTTESCTNWECGGKALVLHFRNILPLYRFSGVFIETGELSCRPSTQWMIVNAFFKAQGNLLIHFSEPSLQCQDFI